jgi:serine O-acetyltransferase
MTMGLLDVMLEDLDAKSKWLYGDSCCRNSMKTLLTDGTFAMLIYRLMQWSQDHRLTPLAMVFNKINVTMGGCIIGRGASFGRRFVLIHSMGVVINSRVHGGDDIFLEHQVTIGAEKESSPSLGNRVFVGAGAKIIGNVSIGDDVKVGANAVVVHDVAGGATVVGIPARPVGSAS